MKKMPVLFVGHGSPMNVLDKENPFNQNFSLITQKFTKPKAILMISAHWYSSRLQVTSGAHPKMIYDFYGFLDELSQVQYPAPGSTELAEQVRSLLQPENIELNPTRGFDHGAWAVLKFLYPDADIPVVQLSLNRLQSAEWHFNLAKKLSALREQGVLIIGSGNIVHNLRAISWEYIDQIGAGYDWAFAFRETVNQAIAVQDNETLVHYEQLGEKAELSVPTQTLQLLLSLLGGATWENHRDEGKSVSLLNTSISIVKYDSESGFHIEQLNNVAHLQCSQPIT